MPRVTINPGEDVSELLDSALGTTTYERRGPARPEGLKPWEPNKLSARHKHVLLAIACGINNKEISEIMGYSESRVSVIRNDPRAAEYMDGFMETAVDEMRDVHLRIKGYANEALDVVVDQMRDPTFKPELIQRAAMSILDRAGYGKIEKRIVATAEITPKAAALLSEALDIARANPIDADYSVIEVESDDGTQEEKD